MRPLPLLAVLLAAAPVPAQAAELTLLVEGAAAPTPVQVALFDTLQAFEARKPEGAVVRLVLPPGTQAVLRGLPPGRYAALGFQDGNGNGQLDSNLLGIPTEPAGRAGFVTLDQAATLTLRLEP